MPMIDLATAILLGTFAALAAVDGLWLHLWRYRLHEQPSARLEHGIHTLHAIVFPFLVWSVFLADGSLSLVAWAAIAAVVVLVAWDAATETSSRDFQGGLPVGEATLHSVLHGLQVAAIALGVVRSFADTPGVDSPLRWVAWNILPGSVVVALIHAVLWRFPTMLPRRQVAVPAVV